jgi:hypothetical protein
MIITYRNRFNKKYGFPPNESHSISEIARLTGYKKSGLDVIFNKGVGAFHTNHGAVRSTVKSPEQWAMGRIYSAVMGGKAARVDAAQLLK